ncbi:hypothetical protein QFZ82_000092 [Streptomyces sp. V4I23]|nr:hypothetical protein [Streptomyces sp. V4I23]
MPVAVGVGVEDLQDTLSAAVVRRDVTVVV